MRILKAFGCLVMLAMLFMLVSCDKSEKVACDHTVSINSCVATPLKVDVHEGEGVCWQPVDQDYNIAFADTSEPTGNPFKVNHGASNAAHAVKGYRGCVPLGKGEFQCEYAITRATETLACADPGVHITPP